MNKRTLLPGSSDNWFPANIHLLDTKTGERRIYLTWESTDKVGLEFTYSDGNCACDCNRADFFARAGNKECDNDAPCGNKRYLIEMIVDDRYDTIVYREFL